MRQLVNWLDNALGAAEWVIRAPYLVGLPPFWAFCLGTFCLSLWAVVLGELTLAAAYRLNKNHIKKVATEMAERHNQSINALEAGDKAAYKKINKLANEAFGKSFFLQLAMGMSSLWPAFFAAAWLNWRFGPAEIAIPLLGIKTYFLPLFVVIYILTRVGFSRIKKHLPFFAQTLALARSMAPETPMRPLAPPREMAEGKDEKKAKSS